MDGQLIDGSARGISGWIFRSCHGRDRYGPFPVCDHSWTLIDRDPRLLVNPLNLGHIVNNGNGREFPSNVAYHELELDSEFDPGLRIHIPNVHYDSHDREALRIVPLLATRDISEGEELYSEYFSTSKKIGK